MCYESMMTIYLDWLRPVVPIWSDLQLFWHPQFSSIIQNYYPYKNHTSFPIEINNPELLFISRGAQIEILYNALIGYAKIFV